MRKIGIMTWFQHKNYGTTLQALALIKSIEKLEYEVEGINYKSVGCERECFLDKITSLDRIKGGIRNKYCIWRYSSYNDVEKEKKYNNFFDDYIPMGDVVDTASDLFKLNEVYDAFVCGSDQIWTPVVFDTKYYLDFVENKNKKVSYAASFGVSNIQNEYTKKKIGELLENFSYISVREKKAQELLEKEYGIEAKVALDPTLLLKKEEWNVYALKPQINHKYILCYFLGENEKNWKAVKKISKMLKLPVVIIPVFSKDYYRKFEVAKGVGPAEFLGLFANASYVCTDSYHGTIFSINFNIPFSSFKRFSDNNPRSQNSRISSILELLDLRNRMYEAGSVYKDIDWTSVNKKLLELRNDSISFLADSILKATSSENKKRLITNTCSGCGMCSVVCPQKAITMISHKGKYISKVDYNICNNCGLCRKICAFNGEKGTIIKNARLFEAKSLSKDTLLKSTSGGISHEIFKFLGEKKYDAYGCEYDYQNGLAVHSFMSHTDLEALEKYQGSKYLQSVFWENINQVFNSKKCVVVGTPCQIAALHNTLVQKNKRNDYVLIDLICHGVPSVNLWKKYLDEKMGNEKCREIFFRDPQKGWKNLFITLKGIDRVYSESEFSDDFYSFFNLQNCYLDSCYECNFRETSKADLRLGDYWGKKYTSEDLKYGTSMVVAFTENGIQLLHEMQANRYIFLEEKSFEDYYYGQGPSNPVKPLYYDQLMDDLEMGISLRKIRENLFKKEYLNKKLQHIVARIKKR